MECPYCGTELNHTDSYGTKDYIIYGNSHGKRGDIFKCPNHEGFEDEQQALGYLERTNQSMEDLDATTWEEIVCGSAVHHVSGSFYTDLSGELKEGYPC